MSRGIPMGCGPTMRSSPTPLRVNEIGPILIAASAKTPSRSIGGGAAERRRWAGIIEADLNHHRVLVAPRQAFTLFGILEWSERCAALESNRPAFLNTSSQKDLLWHHL